MKECVIHGATIPDWDALYTKLAADLALPTWFGRNLDALYDCLTDICEPTAVGLFISDDFTDETDVLPDNECFGGENGVEEMPRPVSYLQKLRRVFADAEQCNEDLAVIFGR